MAVIDELVDTLIGHNGGPPLNDDEIERLLDDLDDETIDALLAPILAEEERAKFSKFETLFPDTGPFRRDLYPKHTEFFAMGALYRERCFMAANRVGKSVAGAYETTAHLTGRYPDWWTGKRFRKPIRAWAAGDTNETTRDIIQTELLGQVITGPDGRKHVDGSGLIPRDALGPPPKWKRGVEDFIDKIYIRHVTGGWSQIAFKSFDQGRRVFQGTARELIWLDEECPADVYGECLMRVATTRGIVLSTFTPLNGLSEMVLGFLGEDLRPGGESML